MLIKHSKNPFTFLCTLVLSCATLQSSASDMQSVALFVDDQIKKSQDSNSAIYARENLSASLSGNGFLVITHETVGKSLKNFSIDGKSTNPYASLSDNSIQTLSQQLGADYFLLLTLNSFSSEIKDLPNFDRKIYTHRLDANFRLASSLNSGTILGKNISATKRIPVTSKISIQSGKQSIINELIDEIAGEILEHIDKTEYFKEILPVAADNHRVRNLEQETRRPSPSSKGVGVIISAKLQNLTWPEISKDDKQNLSLTGTTYQLEASDAEIEIDGVFVGNCSPTESIFIKPGLRRLKVIRSGFTVEEKVINAYEGLQLKLQLTPTDEEYKLWQSQIAFLQSIKIGEKLTDAEVRKAEGMYEFLKNSKYELPQNITFKSLY